MQALPFIKMHGAGNDFVVLDLRARDVEITPGLACGIGDRHRGVGFDQLVVIGEAQDADAALRFFNADGSEAGACGNGTRCAAALLMGESSTDRHALQTVSGRLEARREGGRVSVNMGQPVLDWQRIPLARDVDIDALPLPGAPSALGMGNPHCVFFVDDAEAVDLATIGPKIETDPLFPQRTNVEFVHVAGPDRLRMRVWERGAGITLACGSGACAAAVAAARRGLTGRKVALAVDGGVLGVDWREDGVWLTGPVSHVFRGELMPDFLASLS